jgi:hypothetical protein
VQGTIFLVADAAVVSVQDAWKGLPMNDRQRLDFLATLDGGFPAITRVGDQDIYGPMLDAEAEPGSREMCRAFRDLIDRAMEDQAKGKK